MIIDNLRLRIESILPDPHCTIYGDNYDTMDWLDARPQPTANELTAIDIQPILAKQAELAEANGYIENERTARDYFLFRLIIEIFEVGVSKGLWVAGDFDQALKDKVIAIKQKLAVIDGS